MKTLGMLGGMSYESTTVYYDLINKFVNQALGFSHSAKILMVSFDYQELEILLEKSAWKELTIKMIDQGLKLKSIGADGLILCANTMHIIAEDVQKSVGLPLIHIAKETLHEAKIRGYKKVGLLGTRYTMTSSIYDQEDIEVIKPTDQEMTVIHEIIYQELIVGKYLSSSLEKAKTVIKHLKERGAEAIVLGCTELPLLIKPEDIDLPILNTLYIHARAAANFVVSNVINHER
ncbi:MAG: amino acid racemase [Acholeplasma sp.]|jgi:aspartate racemase|nr:MAG: amino acid racemase [Acholeplasma sp.]